MPWTAIVALNDATTAAIAVVALLVGAFIMARGSRRDAARPSAAAQPPGPAAPAIPVRVAAPTAVKIEAPRPTTFRHGSIRVGGQDTAAGNPAPDRQPRPPAGPQRIRMRPKREPQDPAAGA